MARGLEHDVAVVGGGLSGLIAARDLSRGGLSVLMLEARDRLGGRTWTRRFADEDLVVDMGGQWLRPRHHRELMREVDRYGVALDASPAPRSYPTFVGGARLPGPVPVPFDELHDLERAIFACQRAAARIDPRLPLDQQGLDDLDIPLDRFLAPLSLGISTLDYIAGLCVGLYAGRPLQEASALQLLATLALLDLSVLELWGIHTHRFASGTGSLVDALAADTEADIRLSSPVREIDQKDDIVRVVLDDEVHRARTVILATPINCWSDIQCRPELSPAKLAASKARTQNRVGKYWALVEGAPCAPAIICGPRQADGLFLTSTEHQLGPRQLMVGFVVDADRFDLTDPAQVNRFVQHATPGARVIKVDSHDWVGDPYSGGAWLGCRPGLLSSAHSELGRPEGRIVMAGADVARRWHGWIEGAVEQGHRAAFTALRILEAPGRAAS